MPFFPPWGDRMPENEEEFSDMLMFAYGEGVKKGRKEGATEITDNVDDFIKRRYFSQDVARGSEFGQQILDLANKLVYQLRHGNLGKIPDIREQDRPKRRKEWGGK